MAQQLIYNPRPMGKSYHLQGLIYTHLMAQQLIEKIKRLSQYNTRQEIADYLNQHEILNAYGIYEQDHDNQEPDSILDAIDYIITNL